jgi:hypothetical protein
LGKFFVNQYHAAYGYGATEIFLNDQLPRSASQRLKNEVVKEVVKERGGFHK